MEKYLKYWWVLSLSGFVCIALCPLAGWYAFANLAVMIAGLYCVHLVRSRARRLEKNKDVLEKLKRSSREKLMALDSREVKSTMTLARLLAIFSVGCAAIDIYACFYNQHHGILMELVPGQENNAFGWLAMGVVFSLISAAMLYGYISGQLHREILSPAQDPRHSLLKGTKVKR